MKTLSNLLQKDKISNGDVRYMTDSVKAELFERTPNCNGSVRERLFWVQHNLTDYPKCVMCDSPLKFYKNTEGGHYKTHCSVKCAKRNPHLIEQQQQTVKQRYGSLQYLGSSDARFKIIATNQKKYGANTPAPWGSTAFKQSMIAKHGVANSRQIETANNQIIRSQIISNIISGKTEASIISCQSKRSVVCQNVEEALDSNRERLENVNLLWKHSICGHEYYSRIVDGDINVCPYCHNGASVLELTLRSIVTDAVGINNVEFKKRGLLTRNREFDIYVESAKLAIEFNGIYWHSTVRNSSRTAHLEKTEESEAQGIKLMHIWEHDFLQKPEIIKSMIMNALGKSIRIGGRTCLVNEIDSGLAKQFLETNHVDGYVGGRVNLGLFYKGDLVAVMTFGKRRFQRASTQDVEIYRFCTKMGYQVQGGASRLFNHYIENYNPAKVISFADRSLGGGLVYKRIGMIEKAPSVPAYFWANLLSPTPLSRFQTQKSKLSKLLGDKFDPNQSEDENMRKMGWFKLWDCGNRVFEWTSS